MWTIGALTFTGVFALLLADETDILYVSVSWVPTGWLNVSFCRPLPTVERVFLIETAPTIVPLYG